MATKRHEFAFADGLRGVAAVQVVLLHYAALFLPVFAHEGKVPRFAAETWLASSPFRFLVDGNTAVCLFFVISGFVLANSFQRTRIDLARAAGKRVTRLFLPVALAAVFAWGCLSACPGLSAKIGVVTSSEPAAALYQDPITVRQFVRDLFANSMLLGYHPNSLFDRTSWIPVQPMTASTNAPFWTLHIELWGSLLVLLLTWLRQRVPATVFGLLVVAALWLTGTGYYSLFVFGLLLQLIQVRLMSYRSWPTSLVGAALIAYGLTVGVTKGDSYVYKLFLALTPITHGQAYNQYSFESTVAGVLIFTGFLLFPWSRRALSLRPFAFLGRLSFGLYLLHFPILFTFALTIFFAAQPLGFGIAATLASVLGIAVSAVLAYLFDQYVDRRVIQLSHRVGQRGERRPIGS